jgi:hypothetical protein
MCGAPERLAAFGARTFLVLSQKNRSLRTVVKTVELMRVVYHLAEPKQMLNEKQN